MEKRISIAAIEPKAFKAMGMLEEYLLNTQLLKAHKELVKMRASQINGCAFCIDMHTKDALKNGETQQRIFLLNAWRETSLFSEEEKTILAMTEEITLISKRGLSDETYKKALLLFNQNYVAQLIMSIAVINAWNRIAISTGMEPAK